MNLGYVLTGDKQLNRKLRALEKRSKEDDKDNVVVGFSMNYAVWVHEMPTRHKVGDWKFLESAYKELLGQIPFIVVRVYRATGSVVKGLLVAGLRIQREAQKRTPVDTGALKASAYTSRERKAGAAAVRGAGRGWNKQQQAK